MMNKLNPLYIKKYNILPLVLAFVLFASVFLTIQPSSANGLIQNVPTAVNGRILPASLSGDTSDWVEIAKNDEYSLIVRKNFINIYPNTAMYGTVVYNDPAWQYTPYSSTLSNQYLNSGNKVRNAINNWFNNRATGGADNLPANARLRDYTMQNTAINALGTTCTPQVSLTDGLSKPTIYQVGVGNDIAFALSYSEAANFCSRTYFMRGNIASNPSPALAVTNYHKISIPAGYGYGMWLRSPGDISGTAGAMSNNFGSSGGRVFQFSASTNDDKGLVYPAVWVKSTIFETTGTVNVVHKDAINGTILRQNAHTLNPGNYGPYGPETFTGYGSATLAPDSSPAFGTIKAGETKTVTYLYTPLPQTATIILSHSDATTGSPLSIITPLTVPVGSYGPYGPESFPGYGLGVLAPYSDPAFGMINVGEVKNIVYLYTPLPPQMATIVYAHFDAVSGDALFMDSFSVSVGSYGPYGPMSFSGYGVGVLAVDSDPASGFVVAGEVKAVVYEYYFLVGSAEIIIFHKTTDGAVLWRDDLTIDAGLYSYSSASFPGYAYVGLEVSSAPASGSVGAGETITITFLYEPMTVGVAEVVVFHKTVGGAVLWRDDLTITVGPYSYNSYPFPGYTYIGLEAGSDLASDTIGAGETRTITFLYEPI